MTKREQFLRVLLLAARRLGFRGWKDSGDIIDISLADLEIAVSKAFKWVRPRALGDHGPNLDAEAWDSLYDEMQCRAPAQAVQEDPA